VSYHKIIETLDAYAPRALIRGRWRSNDGCCALGACVTQPELLGAESTGWMIKHRYRLLDELGLSAAETRALVRENDRYIADETPAARYARVMAWLRRQP